MKSRYYVQFVRGLIEPELIGPFDTPRERDDKAREIVAKEGLDDHAIFRLDVLIHGRDVVAESSTYAECELFEDVQKPESVDA